ncbi:MAG: DUF819 family protein [Bacteroidota bacterium]
MFSSPLFILIVLSANIILSIWLEEKTKLKHLGAALLVIIITAVTANLEIIPSASDSSPMYDAIFKYIAPISIFYLLLGVSLKELKRAGLPMLILFGAGAFATLCGVALANYLFGQQFGVDAPPIAGMITGTYIGGSINFNAVAVHYDMMKQGPVFASIVAVDNIFTTIWMVVTLTLPRVMNKIMPAQKLEGTESTASEKQYHESKLNIYSLAILIAVGLVGLYVSEELAKLTGVPSILILTTIALVLAQFKRFSQLSEAKIIGLYLIYLFLAVIGAFCEIGALAGIGSLVLSVLGYLFIVIIIHGIVIIGIARLLKFDWYLVAVASQANIGGSSSALALAKSLKRNDLLLPAVLIGSLGNAIGTYLGFMMVGLL